MRFFPLANDFYLLRSFVVYSDVVAVPHFEEDVVMVSVFGPWDEVAFEYFARLASYFEEASDMGAGLLELTEDFSMVSFQFGRCQRQGTRLDPLVLLLEHMD